MEVLNKFIVDSQIDFELPQRPAFLFYELVFDNEQVTQVIYALLSTPQESQGAAEIVDSDIKDPFDFVQMLSELNKTSEVVFLIGFNLSVGCYDDTSVYSRKLSVDQIPVVRLFNSADVSVTPDVKYYVKSFKSNTSILIK